MPMTMDNRIETLRARLAHYGSASEAMSDQRKAVFVRSFAETTGQPQPLRAAKALAAFLREKDLVMFEEDLLAGFQQGYDFTQPFDLPCFDGVETAWPYCRAGDPKGERADLAEAFALGMDIGLLSTCLGGHTIPGFERVLTLGFGGLAARAEGAEASATVCQAVVDYALRYAERAEELSHGAANENRAHLVAIAESCRRIAAGPAETLRDAVQLVALTQEVITCEQPCGSLSLGRVDQYLLPFYQADLAAGRLNKDDAFGLVLALWLKLGSLAGSFQNVTLGGLTADGSYLANDLTFMGLRATARLRMDQPLLSLRCHRLMPDELWDEALELISLGLGFPALFNDEVVIDAKTAVGISAADAVDYGIVGCVEMNAPGKEWAQTEAVRLNWAKVLELMLSGGRCTITGKRTSLVGNRPLSELMTFEAFLTSFKELFGRAIDLAARATILRDEGFAKCSPYPFLSSTMDGCAESGLDVVEGGTTYNLLTFNSAGMADVVDSLAAIHQVVYEKQSFSLVELAEALRSDFAGAEALRTELAALTERFGNDRAEPDELLRDLTELLHERLAAYKNSRGGGWQMGLYTVSAHAFLGACTGALPTGRPARLSLASGCSSCQGADMTGPTAVVRSLTKLDHRKLGNGMVLDLKFSPSFFTEPGRKRALRDLIETYFDLGGMEVQFNVIARQTLLAAQADPDSYRDLIVRVSGFSAYFTTLDSVCQNEIIARTEHGSVDVET